MTDVVLLSEEGIDPTSPEARLVPTKRLRLDSEISTDNEFDLEGIVRNQNFSSFTKYLRFFLSCIFRVSVSVPNVANHTQSNG